MPVMPWSPPWVWGAAAAAPLPVGETGGSKGKGGGRGGGSPTRRAARLRAVLQPEGRKMGRPRPTAGLGPLYPCRREGRSPLENRRRKTGAAAAAHRTTFVH